MLFKYIPDDNIYIYNIPEQKIYMILNFPDKISMSIPILSAMIFSGDFDCHASQDARLCRRRAPRGKSQVRSRERR